jgi:hypothetical protein
LIEAMLRLWQGLVELRTSGRTALVKASEWNLILERNMYRNFQLTN